MRKEVLGCDSCAKQSEEDDISASDKLDDLHSAGIQFIDLLPVHYYIINYHQTNSDQKGI